MPVVCLHDQAQIAAALRAEAPLHLYALGDLDPFFWPYTTWYGLEEHGQISEVLLAYTALPDLLVLHALSGQPARMARLLGGALHLLPRRIYAHLSPGLREPLAAAYTIEPHGEYQKMLLSDPSALEQVATQDVQQLSAADLPQIAALFARSYPDNWFDARMLETGQYYGSWRAGQLVSIAGIHVYAPSQRIAVLGNITTDPALRGQGLARRTTARLCRELLRTVDIVGLNVRADNRAAIACYSQLGFSYVADYEECLLTLR
jgi:ribosomal protein S18 acetylase RimI-like enzyme